MEINKKELDDAIKLITSTISKCENMKLKFAEGTSQHTLLVNRIRALYISKALIEHDCNVEQYALLDLERALPPVVSIINKTEKAQSKYEEDTVQYRRFAPIIKAMYISKEFIENEISKRTK